MNSERLQELKDQYGYVEPEERKDLATGITAGDIRDLLREVGQCRAEMEQSAAALKDALKRIHRLIAAHEAVVSAIAYR